MRVCCAIDAPMQQLPDSDVWVVTVRVEELAQALISYALIPTQPGQRAETNVPFSEWRGPQAPPAPRRAQQLRGQIEQRTLASVALDAERDLTVYLPPGHDPQRATPVIYLADGESVPEFAEVLEPLITDGTLPALMLVGVHAASDPAVDPSGDLRSQEYIPQVQRSRFAAHERFFVEEVRQWAERALGASSVRTRRGIFGASNGAVFAATIGARHPELYGHVVAFSMGVLPEEPPVTVHDRPDYYLVAGTLEADVHSVTQQLATRLQLRQVRHVFRDRVAGHDAALWEDAFPAAVRWACTPPSPGAAQLVPAASRGRRAASQARA